MADFSDQTLKRGGAHSAENAKRRRPGGQMPGKRSQHKPHFEATQRLERESISGWDLANHLGAECKARGTASSWHNMLG